MLRANAINDDIYERLYIAYEKTRSIRSAALEAGVSPSTAAKYINGVDLGNGVIGIRERMRRMHDTRLNKLEQMRISELEAHTTVAYGLLGKFAEQVKNIELRVTGDVLPNGKIAVDEVTFRRITDIGKTLGEYSNSAYTERKKLTNANPAVGDIETPTRNGDITVNILNQQTGPFGATVQSRAFDVLARFEQEHIDSDDKPQQRTDRESRLTEVFTKATLRKKGTSATQAAVGGDTGEEGGDEEESLDGYI